MTPFLPSLLAAGIGPFGLPEILIVLFLVILLFGAKRLPDLARSFGKSIREFKKGATELSSEVESAAKEDADEPKNNGTSHAKPAAESVAKKGE